MSTHYHPSRYGNETYSALSSINFQDISRYSSPQSHKALIEHLQPQLSMQFQSQPQPHTMITSSIYKSDIELSGLCTFMIRMLCGGNLMWDMDKVVNFTLFCNRLITQLNIPPPVVYTSLKYFQCTLAYSINEYNIIDLSDIAHEYSLFTVSLLIAYKFLEDNPPYLKQWSYVSIIPINELVSLEAQILQKLDYSLNISNETLELWSKQCNTIYDIMISFSPTHNIDQLISVFDLHMTQSRLGCCTLLPVLLLDDSSYLSNYFIVLQEQQMTTIITTQHDYLILSDNTNFFNDNAITPYCYSDVTQDNHRCTIPPWLQEVVPVPMDYLWYLPHNNNTTVFL
ncbi:MAG: hypothetical protein EXX96DRAFT_607192 [Benjaminiella poitrasii]|nr:MAG: hypothetical protein EXX96DRAFT_607192 [Benjaminiella poitrasii]